MRRPLSLASLTAAAAAVALGVTSPAAAVSSYNSLPAPERSEVGALIVQWDRDNDPTTPDVVDWYCSGTMIDEDVFLTAAHCTTDWSPGVRFYVSLDQNVQAKLDQAKAEGLSPAETAAFVGVEGTEHTSPSYPGNSADSHDIAVITFDSAQAAELAARWTFTPATLPARNSLSALSKAQLETADWQVVGYGTEEAVREPGGHVHPGGGVRMKADLGFDALNPTWVRLGMQQSRNFGGACYGDSGGPNFATVNGQRVLAGTTITGDVPCYATNVAYRMDTDTARGFLGQFVALP